MKSLTLLLVVISVSTVQFLSTAWADSESQMIFNTLISQYNSGEVVSDPQSLARRVWSCIVNFPDREPVVAGVTFHDHNYEWSRSKTFMNFYGDYGSGGEDIIVDQGQVKTIPATFTFAHSYRYSETLYRISHQTRALMLVTMGGSARTSISPIEIWECR